MFRKGATHADWAISLGLFLIYILSMFMILQPGVEPIFKEEQLLDVLEEGIESEARFVVSKTPLIINTLDFQTTDDPPVDREEKTYKIKIEVALPLTKEGKQAAVFDSLGLIERAKIDLVANTIEFESELPIVKGINKFWIYEILVEKQGDPYEYDNSGGFGLEELSNPDDFEVTFGSPELIRGIDWDALYAHVVEEDGISCTEAPDYKILKQKLDFPLSKEFSIQVLDKPTPRYEPDKLENICNVETPYEQASVFTREWIAYKVDKFGVEEPVRLHVEVW